MHGEYPFVRVGFADGDLPVQVRLEAFTPFIPLNVDDSSIPGAVIRYYVKNTTSKPAEVTIAGTLPNAVGYSGTGDFNKQRDRDGLNNEYKEDGVLRGLLFSNNKIPFGAISGGTMALMTANPSVTYKRKWLNDSWWDGAHDFWDDFRDDGRLEPEPDYGGIDIGDASSRPAKIHIGSLGIYQTIKPGEETVFEFYLTWHFPNRAKQWAEDCGGNCQCGTTTMYYANLFADAWAAGKYVQENLPRLEKASRDFHKALFGGTLPGYVIDAAPGEHHGATQSDLLPSGQRHLCRMGRVPRQQRLLPRLVHARMELRADACLPVSAARTDDATGGVSTRDRRTGQDAVPHRTCIRQGAVEVRPSGGGWSDGDHRPPVS